MDFHDSPPVSNKYRPALRDHWVEVARQLNENPGAWANVGNYALGISTRIKQGKYRAFLPDSIPGGMDPELYMNMHYEVTTRRTGVGRNDIWMRALPTQ